MEDFVHLHVHTQYSILDGQSKIPHLVDKAIKDGMKGMAVTDHGVMFGIKELTDYCAKVNKDRKKEGLEPFKPIIGCEMYVARRRKEDREKDKGDMSGYHLIVLAKNYNGYKNLIQLVSNAWVDGYYMRPRTDRADLEKYHEDLIVCSACIAGEVPSKILHGDIEGAREACEWYHNLFGDDYYLELQRHEVKEPLPFLANREAFQLQQKANKVLIEMAREYGIKLVCTNDCHFEDKETAEAHDHLLCIATGKDLDDPNRMRYSKQEWFKTRQEMNDVFSDIPEALSNTLEVLDKVEIYSIDHGPIMPFFPIPESFGTEEQLRQKVSEEDLYKEFTSDENGENQLPPEEGQKVIDRLGGYDKIYRIKFEAEYLRHLAYEGARQLYGDPLPADVDEHVNFELHVMKTMGFPGYFLIVSDFIRAAREELGVMVGPGRGSAAGSVVAYCLGITKIDPLKYDLLFERFLNPDRVNLPDIDTDFDDDGRGKVLRWVMDKYGHENCAHIITYGSMATKNSIKDVARVEKLPLDKANALCKAIPDRLPDGAKMNLPNAIKYTPAGQAIHIKLCEAPPSEAERARYVFTCQDTGIGMSQDYLPHIFEEFSRERSSTENQVIGTGLGLSIVKSMIELMGGEIHVESHKGCGTCFRVDLPLHLTGESEVKREETEAASDQGAALTGKRILLAEDNDLNAEIACELLEEKGILVERAEDGQVCCDRLIEAADGYYDLILMDIQMPRMNGYEATRRIRKLQDPKKSQIPIIAMTANAFAEDRQAAKDAGMNDHVAKPIHIDILLSVLKKYV